MKIFRYNKERYLIKQLNYHAQRYGSNYINLQPIQKEYTSKISSKLKNNTYNTILLHRLIQ